MNKRELNKLLMENFRECNQCASQPGSPVICPSCIHNRTLVDDLQKALTEFVHPLHQQEAPSAPCVIENPGDDCLRELAEWAIKWGHFQPDSLIQSVEASASVDNIRKIKVGLIAQRPVTK